MEYLDNFLEIAKKTNTKYRILGPNTILFHSKKSLVYNYLLADLETNNIDYKVIPHYSKNPNNKIYTQNYIIKINNLS